MGIDKDLLFLLPLAAQYIKRPLKSCSVCDLGNQRMRFGLKKTHRKYLRGKISHYDCIDTNGKDGALEYDLSKEQNFKRCYDIVTNFGTIEHVENDIICFKNIDKLCGCRGAMVHVVPALGYYDCHGLRQYSLDQLMDVADEYGYKIKFLKEHIRGYLRRLCIAIFVRDKYA